MLFIQYRSCSLFEYVLKIVCRGLWKKYDHVTFSKILWYDVSWLRITGKYGFPSSNTFLKGICVHSKLAYFTWNLLICLSRLFQWFFTLILPRHTIFKISKFAKQSLPSLSFLSKCTQGWKRFNLLKAERVWQFLNENILLLVQKRTHNINSIDLRVSQLGAQLWDSISRNRRIKILKTGGVQLTKLYTFTGRFQKI